MTAKKDPLGPSEFLAEAELNPETEATLLHQDLTGQARPSLPPVTKTALSCVSKLITRD